MLGIFCSTESRFYRAVYTDRLALFLRLYEGRHKTSLRDVTAAQVPRRKKSPDGPLYGESGTLATNHGFQLRLAERRPAVLPPVGLKTDFS
jgi:hypothetical protein